MASPSTQAGPKTATEIVDAANRLAREFYSEHGYVAPEGHRFDLGPTSRERQMWRLACIAFEAIEATSPDDALTELEPAQP